MRMTLRCLTVLAAGLLLTGSAQAQRQPGFPGGGFPGGPMNLRMMLAQNKPLQEELKLTDDQIEALTDLAKKQAEANRNIFAFGGNDEEQIERLKTQIKLIEERVAVMKKTLSKEQFKRLTQIERQQMGMGAFTSEAITKELKFSDEQKEKIKTINDDLQKEMREVQRAAFTGGFDPEKMQEMQKKTKNLREEAQEKMEKTLSDDQKKMWKEMLGETFDTSKLIPMFRPKE